MTGTDWLRAMARRQRTPWTNAVRTTGACIHDVIYSRCYCTHRPAAQ